jgi:hypothetical protein
MGIVSFIQRKYEWSWALGKSPESLAAAPAQLCEYGHSVHVENKLCSYGHRAARAKE